MHIFNESRLVCHFIMIYFSHQPPQFLQFLTNECHSWYIIGVHSFHLSVELPFAVAKCFQNCPSKLFDAPEIRYKLIISLHFLYVSNKKNLFLKVLFLENNFRKGDV